MQIEDVRGLISLAGVITQIAGSVLVLLLFALLQRRARRDYFGWWTAGWALVTFAIVAVAAAYLLLVRESPIRIPDHPGLRVLYATYQLAKLGGLFCLLAGSAAYVGRPLTQLHRRTGAVVVVAGAAVSIAVLPDLSSFVAWQAPLAVLAFAASGALLLRLPDARRSFGSVATGLTFLASALVWTVYGIAFRTAAHPIDGVVGTLASVAVQFNSYIDFLLTVFLGFGMVVLLMEDAVREVEEAKREVDEAHARLAAAHDRLQRTAAYDPLTGCLNRQGFTEHMASAGGALAAGTVVVVDMDNLKEVNDRHGHPAGDAMLRHLAGVLEAAAPEGSLLFRWGGDEFLILLADTPPVQAEELFRRAVRAAPALALPGVVEPCAVEASVGASRFTRPEALEAAVRRADRGMYEHKQWRKRHTGSQPAILP